MVDQIYVQNKLQPICSKLIFKRLLIKLATECTYRFPNRYYKQIDGWGGPLSVRFSEIYMVKMEKDVVIPQNPIFYRRSVDDIYSRRKKGDNVLFNLLNNYHPKIELTIEVSPVKFLDTKLTNNDGIYGI